MPQPPDPSVLAVADPQDTPDGPGTPWWARDTQQPFLTPQQVQRRTLKGTLLGLLAGMLVAGAAWWVLALSEVDAVQDAGPGLLAYKQTNDALIGGCGPVFRHEDPTADSGIVPSRTVDKVSNRLGYPTIVPMKGPFWDVPVIGQRFWARDAPSKPVAENLLRNMWDGALVVYYNTDVTNADLRSLARLAAGRPDLDLYVVPWEARVRGDLPLGRDLAFATWNASQSCHLFAATALYDFRADQPLESAPGANDVRPPVLSTTPPVRPTLG